MESKPVFASVQHVIRRHPVCRAYREIIYRDKFANERANRLRLGREFEPVIQAAAFIGFKMTPGDVPELRGVDQRGDCLAKSGEHGFEPGMEQQRLIVADKEMIELHVEVRDVYGKAEQIRRDF